MPFTTPAPNPMRRTVTIGIVVAILAILAGCTADTPPTDTSQEQTEQMPDITDELLRHVVTTAANDTMRALGLEPTATETDAQVIACTDAFGNEKNERFSRLTQEFTLADGGLTDEQINMLEATVDEGFRADSVSSLGTRRITFVARIETLGVIVDVVRETDGSAGLASETLCLG